MNKDIENIIKKNLPEETPFESKLYQNRNGIDYCGTCEQAWEYCSCPARNTGFNQALSQIPVSLIADEVLKVVGESKRDFIIRILGEQHKNELQGKGYDFYFVLRTELDNLSPNKENKNI